ncbi:hypothetical protein JAO74_01615 [Sphingomonas sp. BT553]|uniref:Lipoprotein n=2 Tax=Sphingomonas mollis TaxID=2795726 RepID=A0ABS0XKB7_9SPHN|nr:hypothetical protein [Sphingomonas sp. BT553]
MMRFLTCMYSAVNDRWRSSMRRFQGPTVPTGPFGDSARSRRWQMTRIGTAMLPVALAACTVGPGNDDAAIVRATLALLQSGRAPTAPGLCVDSRPRGAALAIFRTMRMTTEPDERPWRLPAPLGTPPRVVGRQLFDDATGRDRLRIREPDAETAELPRETQARFDAAARALSLADRSESFAMNDDIAPAGMAVRWWLMNRIMRGCERTFVLSRIARNDRIGFITVTADHWGTTYAVERATDGWRVTGQWDKWLY